MGVIGGPDTIVTDELILALDAGNKKSYPGSGTTWFDLSSNNNNATMANAVWTDDGPNSYWLFDGTSDYGSVSALNGFTNTTNVTVFCIFKASLSAGSGASGGRGSLFGFGTQATDTNDIYHWGSTEANAFGLNTWNGDAWGVDDVIAYNSADVFAGTFQFKFGGSNTSGFNMFINGQEQTESQVQGAHLTRNRSTQFGIGHNGWHTSDQTWKGRTYYIAVYNDSVTTAKALQNYNSLKDRYLYN